MEAEPIGLLELLNNPSRKWIIPVYQRHYSWGDPQQKQLFDDILQTGEYKQQSHFLGVIVDIPAGSEQPLKSKQDYFLIDGQQRFTTVALLLIALAQVLYDKPTMDHSLNWEKVLKCVADFPHMNADSSTNNVINKYWQTIYLKLSQQDNGTFESLINHVHDPNIDIDRKSNTLYKTYRSFLERIGKFNESTLENFWYGLNHLEVVNISLERDKDNPQHVFQSLNSTGLPLAPTDLVRNYLLMNRSKDDMEQLYKDYWNPIEKIVTRIVHSAKDVKNNYESIFDAFLRNWLTIQMAPKVPTKKDLYTIFIQYISSHENELSQNNKETGGSATFTIAHKIMKDLRYSATLFEEAQGISPSNAESEYVSKFNTSTPATFDKNSTDNVYKRLQSLHLLNREVEQPLIMYLLSCWHEGHLDTGNLLTMLQLLESYLFRSAVCRTSSSGLNKLFPQLIGIFKQQGISGNRMCFTFERELLKHKMPNDETFSKQLLNGDCYNLRDTRYLLITLENSYHPDSPSSFNKKWTIEHILPQKINNSKEWQKMLGSEWKEVHRRDVNRLGNLMLIYHNSELSNDSFASKKGKKGGYNNYPLAISRDVLQTDNWDDEAISKRCGRLAQQALRVWPYPKLPAKEEHQTSHVIPRHPTVYGVKFAQLYAAGLLHDKDQLTAKRRGHTFSASVSKGKIRIENGETWDSPSRAAMRALSLYGVETSVNGWIFWFYKGHSLDELRKLYKNKYTQ